MHNKIVDAIKKLTGHKHVHLTDRGNSAIFSALTIAKKLGKTKSIIPDQGGWPTYKDYSEFLGLNIQEVKTDFGIIDLDDLKKKIDSNSVFIMHSLAGYFADQPIKEVSGICKESGCLFVLDVCGSIGDDKLCDGNLADIMVCSFGRWKIVNAGYGGFISTNSKDYFELADVPFSVIKVNESSFPLILDKLNNAKARLDFLHKTVKKVKDDLNRFDIIHKEKNGLNVAVRFSSSDEKNNIIDYCKKNKFEFVECPKDIRVKADAISIEIKRL